MSLSWKKFLVIAPSLGALAMVQTALAEELPFSASAEDQSSELLDQIDLYNQESGSSINQVNSVFQLEDVSPDDWAFEALRNLVERYGCIAGYPDGTFRGNEAMTRYEFAAGLNACLQQIETLIATDGADVSEEDLATLQRLTQEFEAELATLATRVDDLEGRTAFLEDTQFSTTTQLNSQVVFDLAGANSVDKAVAAQDEFDDDLGEVDSNLHLTRRIRMNFDSSFTGEDRLRVRFQESTSDTLAGATGARAATRNLSAGGTDGNFELGQLMYSFPVGDNVVTHLGAQGVLIDDVFNAGPTAGFAYNSINLFTAYNNLVYDVSAVGGASIGANIFLGDRVQVDLGYFATDGRDPEEGLFGGDYSAGGQIGVDLGDVDLAATYLRSYQGGGPTDDDQFNYDLSGFVGSPAAANPFRQAQDGDDLAASADHFGLQANWRVSPRFNVGGYFGYVNANTQAGPDGDAELINWLVNASFPDLGAEGSALILAFGQPPKLTSSSGSAVDTDPDNGYLLSAEYQFPVSDNIDIATGGYALFNPNHNSDNDDIYVGRVRTVFSF
ncbi:S-layer protein [Euhalothece natronophila Z-M001]|uniref:S-layer protein n=1 Tax=Euhalothece natronophila Z-M001 TaxID=522448 RepID=A0A5B8NLV3_9CHRO|nr:iron uptake porin [Euhalothece natronophila]QDZ39917.1 S-layer protein [Euhalothece natronophila Z-M001]